jgi:hypothetical protein
LDCQNSEIDFGFAKQAISGHYGEEIPLDNCLRANLTNPRIAPDAELLKSFPKSFKKSIQIGSRFGMKLAKTREHDHRT